ncbi:MAG: hypothetical protein HN757_02535 [Calditrichaeota bacterium]|nr:hypothetical protein [Calditrichota bacterium]
MLRKYFHILLLRPLIKLIFGVGVLGRENFNDLKQFIIIANHNSHLDVLLLFKLLPVTAITRTHPIAEELYFSRNRFVCNLMKFALDPIWVKRGKQDRGEDPFKDTKALLDVGENIIIFPEGTRGEPGEMVRFKSGIGRLVQQYPNIPILPVYLSGPEKVLPKNSWLLLPFYNQVTVGPPQYCVGAHHQITRLLENVMIEFSQSESTRRHKRVTTESQKPLSITFLGIDGSGKSTVSRTIAEEYSKSMRVCLISDSIELYEDGALQRVQQLNKERVRQIIGNYAKTAKSLKHYKIPKLTELILRNSLFTEVQKWYNPGLIVMDGAPLLNIIAWAILYKGDALTNENCSKLITILNGENCDIPPSDAVFKEFQELVYLKRFNLNSMIMPDMVFMVDVLPETSIQRINLRGETKQVHETEDKLTRLRQAYLQLCEVIETQRENPVHIVSGESVQEKVSADCLEVIETFFQNQDKIDE